MNDAAPPVLESLRVFDNFLLPEHLEAVRQSALGAGFGTWTPNTAGPMKLNSFKGVGYVGRHDLVFAALHGRTGRVPYPQDTKFRLTGADSDVAFIHTDRGMGNWTAILYLSPDLSASTGTAFYHYKPNPAFAELERGLSFCPAIEPGEKRAWAQTLIRDMDEADPENTDKWKKVCYVEAVYNRVIIFPSGLFHCRLPRIGTGDAAENSRLIWVSHFML